LGPDRKVDGVIGVRGRSGGNGEPKGSQRYPPSLQDPGSQMTKRSSRADIPPAASAGGRLRGAGGEAQLAVSGGRAARRPAAEPAGVVRGPPAAPVPAVVVDTLHVRVVLGDRPARLAVVDGDVLPGSVPDRPPQR